MSRAQRSAGSAFTVSSTRYGDALQTRDPGFFQKQATGVPDQRYTASLRSRCTASGTRALSHADRASAPSIMSTVFFSP